MSTGSSNQQQPAPDNPWVLKTTQPHADALYLANGYMSTALDFSGGMLLNAAQSRCYIRGVYTVGGPDAIDRLAVVPCWNHFRYGHAGDIRSYRRELDLRHGTVRTEVVLLEARGEVAITGELFLSRADQHQAVIRITVVPSFDGEVRLIGGLDCPSGSDAVVLTTDAGHEFVSMLTRVKPYGIEIAQSLRFGHNGANVDTGVGQSEAFAFLTFDARAGVELCASQFARIVTSLEASNPLEQASSHCVDAATLHSAHCEAWETLWKTDIEIDGDAEMQQFVRSALFYLWSSIKEDDSWSIAPMGLSGNFYNGHIFWDAELWMYPSLLVTHPALGKSCVAYRERTLEPARQRARGNGCDGAQFPWEGGFTGVEMTPHWAETRDFQLHVTADVAIGQWWYYLVTGDLTWLTDHGYPVIRECAEYWVSRVEYNADWDRYEVSDVVCADEYAEHVNNNAFTNASIRKALQIAARAAQIVEQPVPPEWGEVAAKIYIPFDEAAQRHVEYDGYNGQRTKQADVELLAYPLEHTTDLAQIDRDLEYYRSVIDPHGPAMSFSVYSILCAQLGRSQMAYDFLIKSFMPNTTKPFWSFSETPTNNEYYFCTGAGGALQALLFGFSGLRLREDHIAISPILPPTWQALRLRNLFVQGSRIDIEIEPTRTVVRRYLDSGWVVAVTEWDTQSIAFDWEGDRDDARATWIGAQSDEEGAFPVRRGQRVPIPAARLRDFRVRLNDCTDTTKLDLHVKRVID